MMFTTIEMKLGNMRKPAEFLVTPSMRITDGVVFLQSDRRCVKIDMNAAKAVLSNGKGGTYSNSYAFLNPAMGATVVDVPADVVESLKAKIAANPSLKTGQTALVG